MVTTVAFPPPSSPLAQPRLLALMAETKAREAERRLQESVVDFLANPYGTPEDPPLEVGKLSSGSHSFH